VSGAPADVELEGVGQVATLAESGAPAHLLGGVAVARPEQPEEPEAGIHGCP
jgi:hypothetical protein